MAQQTIGLGTVADDGTGDDLRTAGGKINDNFTELYAADAAIAETIDDRVATLLTEGTNITITYDDGAGTLTIDAAATAGGISDFNEAVDDRVGALIDGGAGINVTYDDVAGTLTISSIAAEGGFQNLGESAGYNEQTGTSYTLVIGDKGKLVAMNNASANTLTVPPHGS